MSVTFSLHNNELFNMLNVLGYKKVAVYDTDCIYFTAKNGKQVRLDGFTGIITYLDAHGNVVEKNRLVTSTSLQKFTFN
jgi:hypothetical protein